MDAYYNNQISMPYFAATTARQRGSGLGALFGAIGRIALPILRNVLFPAAKQFTRNLAAEAVPEIDNVLSGNTNIKKALKRTASRAAQRSLQRGRGGKQSKISEDKQPLLPKSPKSKKRAPVIKKKNKPQRSRYDILENLKN
jgi:hypothetical protein